LPVVLLAGLMVAGFAHSGTTDSRVPTSLTAAPTEALGASLVPFADQGDLVPEAAGQRKPIALAFDDFPFPDETPKLLEALARCNVQVTFFAIGHKLKEHPEFAAQALYQGHDIENHTFDHVRLIYCTPAQIHYELQTCNQVIQNLTGVPPHFLRCPGGRSNAAIRKEALACGLECVDTRVTNTGDMDVTASQLIERCKERAHSGAILSLHDGVPATIAAMPTIVSLLRSKGYQFETVDQMLRKR
jgi:peptidoglycan/xylan/chitin deacetylase (PgdA/CDA1 family)